MLSFTVCLSWSTSLITFPLSLSRVVCVAAQTYDQRLVFSVSNYSVCLLAMWLETILWRSVTSLPHYPYYVPSQTVDEANQAVGVTRCEHLASKQASKHIYLSNDRLPKKPLAQQCWQPIVTAQTVNNQLTQRTTNLHPGHSTQT